jgi:hypothetical protein
VAATRSETPGPDAGPIDALMNDKVDAGATDAKTQDTIDDFPVANLVAHPG